MRQVLGRSARVALVGSVLASAAACLPPEEDDRIYWKDTLDLTETTAGEMRAPLWTAALFTPLVGSIEPMQSGGFVAPLYDEQSSFAWLRAWDGAGRVRFDTENRWLHTPLWAVTAVTPLGNVVTQYSTAANRGSDEMRNVGLVIGVDGGIVYETVAFEFVPWTLAKALPGEEIVVVAQPDPTQSTVMCRVSATSLQPLWCDVIELPFASYDEDTPGAYEHRYVPVVQSIVPANDGGFYIGGVLPGTREVDCCEDCYCVDETVQSWVAKYSSFGREEWFHRFASDPWKAVDVPMGMAATEDGVLVGGWWASQFSLETRQNPFVYRLDSDGSVRYARSYEGPENDVITAFTSDGRGGAYAHVTGDSVDGQLMMRLDDNGDVLWSAPFSKFKSRYGYDEQTGFIDTTTLGGVQLNATPDGGFLVVAYGSEDSLLPTEVAKYSD